MASVGKNRQLAQRLLKTKGLGGAPHLTEFVECMVREFGGAEATAKEMKTVYDSAPQTYKLAFWRMFMKAVEINTEMGGANNDFSMATEDEIAQELTEIVARQGKGYGVK